jgi:hypothetical protein
VAATATGTGTGAQKSFLKAGNERIFLNGRVYKEKKA